MQFDLTLHAITPYHSAPMQGAAYIISDDGRMLLKSSGVKGSPLTSTYKEPKYIAEKGEVEYFPVIRSLQIVKKLRNILNRNILESFRARDLSIAKASTYAGLTVGAASGKPAPMTPTLDQIAQAYQMPVALFGGGSFMMSSIIEVLDANILHQTLIQEGVTHLPAHFNVADALTIEPYRLTFPVPIYRADPINDIKSDEQMSQLEIIENHQKQIKDWQEVVIKARAARKSDEETKKQDLRNMVATEAVMPGVVFSFSINLPDNVGQAVIGAVVSAISECCSEGLTIGGRVSRGMGKFKVKASFDDALLNLDMFESEIEAYGAWLETVTPTDLADYFEV